MKKGVKTARQVTFFFVYCPHMFNIAVISKTVSRRRQRYRSLAKCTRSSSSFSYQFPLRLCSCIRNPEKMWISTAPGLCVAHTSASSTARISSSSIILSDGSIFSTESDPLLPSFSFSFPPAAASLFPPDAAAFLDATAATWCFRTPPVGILPGGLKKLRRLHSIFPRSPTFSSSSAAPSFANTCARYSSSFACFFASVCSMPTDSRITTILCTEMCVASSPTSPASARWIRASSTTSRRSRS
mmetsp:Transcript_2923/g.6691  ORF Transcript_2923/g.6691 Transcript_2923/m.6691 type:complete len:243 (-) Transcript_2923:3457-4185(-)